VKAARMLPFWDFRLAVYEVEVTTPDGTALALSIYTPESVQDRVFDPGDCIRARVWLFGQVLPKPDDLPAQSQEEAPS
jgi:hypothetical protein